MILHHDQQCEVHKSVTGLCNCGIRNQHTACREQIKSLEAEVAEAHVDCIRLQQEINYLRMEPCQLPHCVAERDDLKQKNGLLNIQVETQKENIMKILAKHDRYREACQATCDYFSYLCQVYHGEKTESGKRKVSSSEEIERLCDRAGKLVKEALQGDGEECK